MDHRIDFKADWRTQMLNSLESAGYKIDRNFDIEKVSYCYWNVQRKEVFPTPRSIAEPRELVVPDELREGYEWLKSKVMVGENINTHLTRRLFNTTKEDQLLNDWGIHHFHLGTTYLPNGMVAGADPILFAVVTDDQFYCVNIGKHGDWADIDLLRIIHKNWPCLIEPYKINIAGLAHKESINLLEMRNAGLSIIHEVTPDAFYISPGGGYSSCGTSIDALRASDFHLGNIEILEKNFRQNLDWHLEKLNAAGFNAKRSLHFTFEVNASGFHVWELALKAKIHIAEPGYKTYGSPAISVMHFPDLVQAPFPLFE